MYNQRPPSFVPALLLNLALFAIVLGFGYPIFNSGDDVYLLYLLGGGFGQPPTELLHYHYGMHPYLGLLLKDLFVQYPGFNWFTALLYLFHFTASTILLHQLMRRNKRAVFSYLLIFFCIEARFLLQPNFTNTALVTALGGMLLLHERKFLPAYLLLIAASFLRLHMLIPIVLIGAPFFINKKFIVHAVALAVIIGGFVFLQQQYYTKHIPNWQQEESYRQTLINYYNVPKKADSSNVLASLVENGLIFDHELLSQQKIRELTKQTQLTIAWPSAEKLYWLMMDNRAFLLLALLFFFQQFPQDKKRAILNSLAIVIVICAGLLLFRKLPPYVIPGCVLIWIAFTSTQEQDIRPGCLFTVIGVMLLYWSVVRLDKLSKWNKEQHELWNCDYSVVANSRKLLVVTDDKFPMDFFSVWDTPHQYPIKNLLYKDHFLNNTKNSSQLITPTPADVYFIGDSPNLIQEYYQLKFGINPAFSEVRMFKCLRAWKMQSIDPEITPGFELYPAPASSPTRPTAAPSF